MRKKKNKANNMPFIESALLNSYTYDDYMCRLQKLATSMFEWVNLPDTMSPRYIEECLYFNGQCAFLYDKKYEYINTKSVTNGQINIYGLPTKLNCFSYGYQENRIVYNGLAKPEKDQACIQVLNNYTATPTVSALQLFALRLYECQRSWDVNIKNQKFPLILQTTDEQKLTLENLYSQVDGNKYAIIVDKNGLDLDSIKVLKTDTPFVADKLSKEKKEIWNEVLTFLGINNIDIEKKERLTSNEGDANNELINLNLQSFLIPRQEACKLFNDLYGLTGDKQISVRVRSDLHNTIKELESSVTEIKNSNEDVRNALNLSYEEGEIND